MARSNIELPADLVSEILLYLPVKSIIRFQCVEKNWYHLFKNPTFVSQHHSLSKKNRGNNHSLVVYSRANYSRGKTCMLSFADDQILVSDHDLHQRLPFHLADIAPLSIGDGLVCLFNFEDDSMNLWNPARKELRALPDLNQYIPRRERYFSHLLGCGMDPLSNDYKVLYVRWYGSELQNQYAIYKMSNDSWRVLNEEDVKIVEDLASLRSNKGNTCVNGVCYWQVFPSFSECAKVLTFLLSTEVFRLLCSPIPGTDGHLIPLRDDRVAYLERSAVWVLNDEENWTKLINIDPLPDVSSRYDLCGFWMYPKVFVEFRCRKHILLYDVETREFSEPGFEGNTAWYFPYVENLITVHPQ